METKIRSFAAAVLDGRAALHCKLQAFSKAVLDGTVASRLQDQYDAYASFSCRNCSCVWTTDCQDSCRNLVMVLLFSWAHVG